MSVTKAAMSVTKAATSVTKAPTSVTKAELVAIAGRHLSALAAGTCELTRADAEREADPELRTLLLGIVELAEKQRAEAAERARAELLATIFDALPLNIFLKDEDGRFLEANRSTCEVVGKRREEVLGSTDYDIFPAALAKRLREADRLALDENRIVVEDERLRRRTGDAQEKLYYAAKLPMTRPSDGVRCLLGVSFSFEWREREIDELVKRHEFVQRVLDQLSQPICVKDRSGRVLFSNKAADAVTQFTGEASEDERERRVFDDLDELSSELPLPLPGGGTRWLRVRRMPLSIGDNEVYSLSIGDDIDDRKQLEQQLEDAAFMMQTVIDASPDCVIVKDLEGRVLYVNEAFAREVSVPRAKLVGLSAFDVLPRARAAAQVERERMVVEGGVQVRTEVARPRDARGKVIYELFELPMRDRSGALSGLISIGRDITDWKQSERALSLAHQQAEAARLAKTEFLANISHEVRTPLSGIIGMTSLLRTTELDAEQADYVATVEASGSTLLNLINDLLDISRLEAGRIALDEQMFELMPCVTHTVNLARPMAREKGLALDLDIAEGVPAFVLGDELRLSQVLSNLVTNALKFTEQGRVLVKVSPCGYEDDRIRLRFAVHDTGIGIPEDKREVLFERFTQVDTSTTRRYGGAGLGLAISQHLVNAMGGRIELQSREGEGSCFSFALSLRRPEEAAVAAATAEDLSRDIGQPMPQLPALRILVAEDNAVNREVALGLLAKLGHRADVVGNGADAVAALEQHNYDMIFMDVHMPVLDGLMATREILSRWPQGRRPVIIAMTADAMNGDRERCLSAGMQDYVSKPVSMKNLSAMLSRWASPAQEAEVAATIDRELFEAYGAELMRELLQAFTDTVPARIEAVKQHFAAGEAHALADEAHALKGAGLNLGAHRFAEVCRELESRGREGAIAGLEDRLEQLSQAYVNTRVALATLLKHAEGG